MKTIGLIGGMSWESTVDYYRIINQTVKEAMGGFHSAKCLLYSVDFHEIEACQSAGDWNRSGDILADAAQRLERGGADFIVLCTNTMHKVADRIRTAVNIPLLHIAEVTAEELLGQKVGKAALLGTKYTMEQDFYKERLQTRGIEVIIPGPEDRSLINHVIFNELCLGKIEKKSREEFLRIMDSLKAQGAQGIILGCTEIGMLVKSEDTDAALFDTTEIHARKAALIAIE
jgi:aspartate racemase